MADFLELAELMCLDALTATSRAAATSARSTRRRKARRCATTTSFAYVAAWEWQRRGQAAGPAQGAARRSRT